MRYFVWLALALLISFGINALRDRKLNSGTVALFVLGAFFLLDLVGAVVGLANATGDIPPEEQGALFGRIVGSAIIPLGIAVVISNRFKKRRDAEELASSDLGSASLE